MIEFFKILNYISDIPKILDQCRTLIGEGKIITCIEYEMQGINIIITIQNPSDELEKIANEISNIFKTMQIQGLTITIHLQKNEQNLYKRIVYK